MTQEEEKRCPLCAEEMDWTDQQLKPCKCGYQVCVWCWHQIMDMAEKDETDGRCPACRAPYDKEKIVGMEANFERVVANNSNRKHKQVKGKPKTNEGRKDLSNVRVIQRKMAYVIGLPLSLADEDLLQRKEFFGQYGKVCKVSLSRTAGGAIQQFINDSCSVYITFSKEEEAIRCIQSVHGFVLEGRFLRASFGTAKYCHAWLKNMPCNNSACLYLHSIGAEEDSFGKDEAAAVHTRSRVQQIVGATHNLHRRSGNVLPPPIDEPFNYRNASTEKPIFKTDLKDVAWNIETSSGYMTCVPLTKDNDGSVGAPNKTTTFVDIVGRSCSSDAENDGNVAEDKSVMSLCSELPSEGIQKDNHVECTHLNSLQYSFSSSSLPANELSSNKSSKEPSREPSNLWSLGRADATHSGAITEEHPGAELYSGKQILHGPYSDAKDDFFSLNDERYKDSGSQRGASHPPSHPFKNPGDSNIYAWRHEESCYQSDYIAGPNIVNNNMDEASLNDGYNEKKFQSSAKSDRIYRCSNSFSNEEIVEHLRRLDDNDDKIRDANPTLEAVESSIISNIMLLNFDAAADSSTFHPSVAGSYNQTDRVPGSLWTLYNNDRSLFSFAKPEGFMDQPFDSDSSFCDNGYLMRCSSPQDSVENKEHYSLSRVQGPSPPGFTLPSREPPPGFPVCEKTDRVFHANYGSRMVKNTTFSENHYRTPSTGNSSNISDVDIIDPAIMTIGRGKPPNELTNSCFEVRSTYASQPSALDDEARLWLLMQQSAPAHQDLNYEQIFTQQAPVEHQELRYSGQLGNGYSSWDDRYGASSRYTSQLSQSNNPSSYMLFSQQKMGNGLISNGYQAGLLDELQLRNELSMTELKSNEKLGFNKLYSGYGDYVLQPTSGDLYTRVFGM